MKIIKYPSTFFTRFVIKKSLNGLSDISLENNLSAVCRACANVSLGLIFTFLIILKYFPINFKLGLAVTGDISATIKLEIN